MHKLLTMKHSTLAIKRYYNAKKEIDESLEFAIIIEKFTKRCYPGFIIELVKCFDIPITHLQEAFWKDTKDRNSCKLVDISFVKKMINYTNGE